MYTVPCMPKSKLLAYARRPLCMRAEGDRISTGPTSRSLFHSPTPSA